MDIIVVIGIAAFIVGVILMRLLLPRWLRSYDRKIAEQLEATKATDERLSEVTRTITQRIEDVENQAREAWSSEIDELTKKIDAADRQMSDKTSDIQAKLVEMIESKLQEVQADNEKRMEQNLAQIRQKLPETPDQGFSQLSEKIAEIESMVKGEIASLQQAVRSVQSQTEDIRSQVNSVEERLAALESDMRKALRGFDDNVTSILTEMKNELLKGVSRVESIESIVTSRGEAERSLLGADESGG